VPPDDRNAGAPQRLTLSWVGEDTLEARFPLQKAGMYLGAVQVGTGAVLPLAPLSLPYSPEFEPRPDPNEGRNTLIEIARVTGGVERTTWDDVFTPALFRNRQIRDLVIPLTLMLLIVHVIEIGGRRLLLFAAALGWLRERKGWLRTVRFPRLRRARSQPAAASASSPSGETTGVAASGDSGPEAAAPAAAAPTVTPPKPATSPLARAKAKSRERMRH
jgi:hypothetical protein